jgi:integrase
MALKLSLRGDYWQITGTLEGVRHRESTGFAKRDKAAAERFLAESMPRLLQKSLAIKAGKEAPRDLTFAKAAMLYIKAGKPTRFVAEMITHWGDTPVKEITSGKVRAAALELFPKATGSTRNRHVIVPTQAIINHAAELELATFLKVKRYKVETTIKTPATWQWVQAFMAVANPNLGALCAFMFMTGARVSEAIDLRWADVDLDAAKAVIRQTKVGKERIAHMPPELVKAIDAIPGERLPEGRVFKYSSRHTANVQWRKWIAKAGIEPLSFHSCRHGFATTLLHRGVDPVTVAKLGGWADAQLVFRTYGHAMNDPTIPDLLTQEPGTKIRHNPKTNARSRIKVIK